jgi:putative transposase
MPRSARPVAVDHPHHVTQRGNYGRTVFESDDDRRFYLKLLAEGGDRFGLRLWAYCLMPNHIHLLCVPSAADSLSRCLGRVHGRFAQRLNHRHQQRGHLWQGRFYSCILDEIHCWTAARYIECNPVRANMTTRAEDHPWSSAAAHCGLADDPLLDSERPFPGPVDDWSAWLAEPLSRADADELRRRTYAGRPWGDETFIGRLEATLGRSLEPRPQGRPPRRLDSQTIDK